MILTKRFASIVVLFAVSTVFFAQTNGRVNGQWGDQGDGTYSNPILPADYSDPDIIRVGKDYYAITSTFQFSPGLTILHSRDMVNWKIINAAVPDLTQMNTKYNWDKMDGYGRCIWAPCITFNKKTKLFYIHWGTPEDGYFVVTAKDVAGKWSDVKKVIRKSAPIGKGWDDCGVLWDEDGQGYFIGTNFTDNYKGWLFKIAGDGFTLQDDGVVIHQSNDRYGKQHAPEANKIFRKDGYYYFYHNEVVNGYDTVVGKYRNERKAAVMRSKYIYGTLADGSAGTRENPGVYEHSPNFLVGYRSTCQGNILSTPDGKKWYFFTHHGATQDDGRPISLVPVIWKNGFPVPPNDVDNDGVGGMIWSGIELPVSKTKMVVPQTSDEFSGKKLGYQWGWNFQPRTDKYSLTERRGFLRLYAYNTLDKNDDLSVAGNSLLQRSYKTNNNEVITRIEISKMGNGQHAGLAHMAGVLHSAIGIYKLNDTLRISYLENRKLTLGSVIPSKTTAIYFKSAWKLDMLNSFSYSTDGINFTSFGNAYQMKGSNYRGDWVGVYTYNNLNNSGYIDVDYLRYVREVAGTKR